MMGRGMNDVTIYALCDPDTSAVRYIGQTNQPLGARLYTHMMEPHEGAPKQAWLHELKQRGGQPAIKALATTDKACALQVEASYIARYQAQGAALVNSKGVLLSGGRPALPVERRQSINVTIRLSPEDRELLERVATDERVPPAVLVRQILMADLKKRPGAQRHDEREQ